MARAWSPDKYQLTRNFGLRLAHPLKKQRCFTNKNATAKGGEDEFGAAGGDRTHDPWLRRPILYPLSYSRIAVGVSDYLTAGLFHFGLQAL